jgi:hypothetical protein
MIPQRMINVPTDAFTHHLANCLSGCDVKLDGTGPLCDRGQTVMESVDWTALSLLRDRAVREIDSRINSRWDAETREKATGLLARLQMGEVT